MLDTKTIKQEIVATTRKRLDRYGRLVELAEQQRSILMEGRHADLADNLERFDPLLLEYDQLTKRESTLRERIEGGKPDLGPEYGQLLDRMSDEASRLRVLTDTNRQLLENAMDLVDFTMAVVCQTARENQPHSGSAAIVLDQRV